jgi:hypothetical protein
MKKVCRTGTPFWNEKTLASYFPELKISFINGELFFENANDPSYLTQGTVGQFIGSRRTEKGLQVNACMTVGGFQLPQTQIITGACAGIIPDFIADVISVHVSAKALVYAVQAPLQ